MRLWIFGLFALTAAAGDFRVGTASVDITPPIGTPMAGYYHVRLSEGTEDPLHAKALVLESAGRRVALVALDLIAAPRPIVDAARTEIERRSGIPSQRVMISATHAHTGPELGSRLLGVEPQIEARLKSYIGHLPALIAQAVEQSITNLRPATASYAMGHEDSISFIRRFRMIDGTTGWNPGKLNPKIGAPLGEIDPKVPVVSFEDEKHQAIATYVNFANHLDAVGGLKYSADYPFALTEVLKRVRGDTAQTIFTIGCAGNINHIDVKRREPQKGPGEAARIGSVLAAAVLKALTRAVPVEDTALRTESRMVPLRPQSFAATEVAAAREVLANYGKPGARPFYDQVNAFKVAELESRAGKPFEAEVQVIALGRDIAWVGLPGEIFVELGKSIQLRSPFRHTIVVELANGNLGYVPDERAYPQGAYEVISTRLAQGSGELLVEAAVALLMKASTPVIAERN